MSRLGRALCLAGLCLALASCEPPPAERAEAPAEPKAVRPGLPAMSLTAVSVDELPGWRADDPTAAVAAFLRSCESLARRPPAEALGPPQAGTVGDWLGLCAEAQGLGPSPAAARGFFEKHFIAYLVGAEDGSDGLFTGYFEAELRGARRRDSNYAVPLYRRPDDLVVVDLGRFHAELAGESVVGRVEGRSLVPYHVRGAIDAGALAGRGLELLWLEDPIDAFLLHVQGSGRVALPDGSTVRVGFAGHNGHDYRSVGRELVDRGELTMAEASWDGIRQWVRDHPQRAAELLSVNRRYVFFREVNGPGPIGAQGVALTPERSLAVDDRFVPLGVPVWLDTTWPGTDDRALRRLLVAQDKGGAIKGVVRGDVFWGFGAPALEVAGRMKSRGRYYLLLPRATAQGS